MKNVKEYVSQLIIRANECDRRFADTMYTKALISSLIIRSIISDLEQKIEADEVEASP